MTTNEKKTAIAAQGAPSEAYEIIVNGRVEVARENKSLLRFLRDDLHITSAKDGCSEGACGACMVIVDGRAVRACVLTTKLAAGRTVTTVEGLTHEEQEAFVYAFGAVGAVQCGFCTPGLVMSSTAFIEKHKGQPVTREEIRRGHAGNLCRCTGYDAIIAAVESCLNDTPPQNTCACLRKPGDPCHHHQS